MVLTHRLIGLTLMGAAFFVVASCDDRPTALSHDITAARVALSDGPANVPADLRVVTDLRAPGGGASVVAVHSAGLFDDAGQVLALDLDLEPGTDRLFGVARPGATLELRNVSTQNARLERFCGRPLRLGVGLVTASGQGGPTVAVDWSAVVVDCSRSVAPVLDMGSDGNGQRGTSWL